MKGKAGILAAVFLLFLPAALGAGTVDMQEGLWEITTTMEMPGMPGDMPPMTQTHCITKEDLQNEEKIIPRNEAGCRLTGHNITGNRVTWTVECDEGSGTGEMTFDSNSYQGTMTMMMRGEGGAQQMNMRFSGRRLGDCR